MDPLPGTSLLKALYFVQTKEYPKCFEGTQKTFAASDALDFKLELPLLLVKSEVDQGRRCVLVLCMSDRDEVGVVANTLLSIKKEIKDKQVIALVFMKFISDKVEDLLLKTGCSDILRYDVSVKAFTHKLTRYLKLLDQGQALEESLATIGGKKTSDIQRSMQVRANTWGALTHRFQVQMVEPLSESADFWLFRKKVYAKKYKETWLIEMIGPSPAAGSWQKSGDDAWEWICRAGFETFSTRDKSWIFTGNKPEYSWVINRWAFCSSEPSLVIAAPDGSFQSRFQLANAETLLVAQNSEAGRAYFRAIKDTYDKKYFIPGDQNDIPWADKVNSDDLTDEDWNWHEIEREDADRRGSKDSYEIKTGVEAMLPCELKGLVKACEVELLEYYEGQDCLSIGLPHGLVEMKEKISIEIKSENIGLRGKLSLSGIVAGKLGKDEQGQTVALLLLSDESLQVLSKIKSAVEERQNEIEYFFELAKGEV